MKSVRVWFLKDGVARYISHLDLNRCMMRAMHRSKIPVWHTEGFNPHPFCTFSLPLSLGFRGLKESMDIKLLEEWPEPRLVEEFNRSLPEGIHVFAAKEPQMKPGEIAYARFRIVLSQTATSPQTLYAELHQILARSELKAVKTSKGKRKEVDVKESLKEYQLAPNDAGVILEVMLPAGGNHNINPTLLLEAMETHMQHPLFADVTRLSLFNQAGVEFA